MSPAERKAREAAADRYYKARAEWQEICAGLITHDPITLKILVTVEEGWRIAQNVAEQGGTFTALEFKNRAPNALLWFSTLPTWQRQFYVGHKKFEAALEEMEYREAMDYYQNA